MLSNFIKASKEARDILKKSDAEWKRIKKLTGAKNDLMLKKIKISFRNGIPKGKNKDMHDTMEIAFKVLSKIGGRKLVGNGQNLEKGTFWVQEGLQYGKKI